MHCTADVPFLLKVLNVLFVERIGNGQILFLFVPIPIRDDDLGSDVGVSPCISPQDVGYENLIYADVTCNFFFRAIRHRPAIGVDKLRYGGEKCLGNNQHFLLAKTIQHRISQRTQVAGIH